MVEQRKPSPLWTALATLAVVLLIALGGWLWFRGHAGAETTGASADDNGASETGAGSSEAGSGDDGGQQGPPPATVRFGRVVEREIGQARLVTGRVEAIRSSVIAAEESGRIITPVADVGTWIEQGERIARLNDDLLRTERRAAAAAVSEARATIDESRAEQRRAQDLVDRYTRLRQRSSDAVTEVQVEEAQRDLAVATARIETARGALAVAEAELAHLDERLEKMSIHAPFTGAVSAKHAELGEWVAPGDPILTLAETEQVDAVIDVPEPLLPGIGEGDEISVRIPALGESFSGTVHRITPRGEPRSKTFPVLVRMTNSGGRIKPGMSARAELPTGDRGARLIVPRDAVQTTPDGFKVFANRGGRAAPVKVYPQFTTRDGFAVEGPLNPGEQVVIEGNERLFGGEPLRAMRDVAPEQFDPQRAEAADNSPNDPGDVPPATGALEGTTNDPRNAPSTESD